MNSDGEVTPGWVRCCNCKIQMPAITELINAAIIAKQSLSAYNGLSHMSVVGAAADEDRLGKAIKNISGDVG